MKDVRSDFVPTNFSPFYLQFAIFRSHQFQKQKWIRADTGIFWFMRPKKIVYVSFLWSTVVHYLIYRSNRIIHINELSYVAFSLALSIYVISAASSNLRWPLTTLTDTTIHHSLNLHLIVPNQYLKTSYHRCVQFISLNVEHRHLPALSG